MATKSGSNAGNNKMKSFKTSPKYNKFIQDRNKALEQLLNNSQVKVSNLLHKALTHSLQICSHRYAMIPKDNFFTGHARQVLQQIDAQLDASFSSTARDICIEFMRLRRYAYMLSSAGETEAIGRAIGRYTQIRLDQHKLDQVSMSKTRDGQDLLPRISYALTKIKHKIMQALEFSRVTELSHSDMLIKVTESFPKAYAYKVPPRVLKPLKEADLKKKVDEISETFIDQSEWDQMVQDYLDGPTFLSERFFNDDQIIYTDEEVALKGYAWQIEQELTDDFVQKVRDGQVDAANENGIEDFVWIAVLDDKTDECCSWRNGLTTSEIESELDGKHADDECDAVTPPAHFNCRCDLAPVGELPDRVEIDFGEFSDWIQN